MKKILGFVVLGYILSATLAAAEVLTLQCVFDQRIDENGISQELMVLEFKVDDLNDRAFMEGNLGIVDVEVHFGESAFSFTERLDSGSVQTTTIASDGSAVHSRNTVMFNEIIAAQHFGRCLHERN